MTRKPILKKLNKPISLKPDYECFTKSNLLPAACSRFTVANGQ